MFSKVYGHDSVKQILKDAIMSKHVGHAYLFEGPRGIGKFTMAMAFAAALLCENQADNGDSCGECKSCAMCSAQTHPDLRIITNQLYDESKKSKDILIDTIRNMKSEIYIRPFSDRKIYIVPRADSMNIAAQNSLLKILEEPPAYCTIILIAENPNMFLPTILSRTVNISFNALLESTVKQYLLEKYPSLSDEELTLKSRMSDGSIGTAEELLSDKNADELRNETLNHLTLQLNNSRKNMYDFIVFLKKNKSEIDFIFRIITDWFRDVMLSQKSESTENIVNADKSLELKKFCASMRNNMALNLLDITLKYRQYVKQNANYPIAMQCMALEYWEVIYDRNYRSPL